MRLMERSLAEIGIARRLDEPGALGGRGENFSEEVILVRGSVLPDAQGLSADEKGLHSGRRLTLLLPADANVKPGDGAWVNGELYRIGSVRRWSAHLEIGCEALS